MSVLRPRAAGAPLTACLPQVLERHTAAHPEAVAIVYGEWRLTYRDLNAQANRLARRLLALGAARNVRVGICLDRGPDLLVALLAAIKTGGSYLPLDPGWPRERLARMVSKAAPRVLVTRAALRDRVAQSGAAVLDLDRDRSAIGAESATSPGVRPAPEDECYVMFTSGSTGEPNGVPVSHGNLDGLYVGLQAELDLGPRDVWTWFHSCSFGFSVWEIWGALLHGGCLVVVPETVRQDPAALGELLVEEGVTVFSQTPSAFRRLLDVEGFHRSVESGVLRYVALSGEALRAADLRAWFGRHGGPDHDGRNRPRLISTYAITEAGGQLTLRVFGPADAGEAGARNLGHPLSGRDLRVVDEGGTPTADGQAGELWAGGGGIAVGYVDDPALTTARFVQVPGPGGRLHRYYRTGDRARRLPDGSFEYLGRGDEQIKFRGHRLEPGEVESALREHPQVRDAAVVIRTDARGDPRLAGFVVPAIEAAADGPEFWPSLGAWGVYDELLYGLMNTEAARLTAFRAAFAAAVPGRTVLDLGAGRDLLLTRLCVEAGARHVYAVEVLPEAAARARELVESAGLADRVTVIQGDIARVALPEPVNVCTQGIIGNIGSADGISSAWNAARRWFAPGCIPVPLRCETRIAGLELPGEVRMKPRFAPSARPYVQRLFAEAGSVFDLRLCLRGIDPARLLTGSAIFETLDFTGALAGAHTGGARLKAARDGQLDGVLLWTVVTVAPGHEVDYLAEQQAWLPVFIPLPGSIAVRAGETIALEWVCGPESHPVYPDYTIQVSAGGGAGEAPRRATCVSRHREAASGTTAIHRRLLAGEATEPVALNVTVLRQWLEHRVPETLVPQAWCFVRELPLGPGGKLDRSALPDPGAGRPALASPALAPRNELERRLALLWTDVLGLDMVGVEDDFFDLGGDSITAVQLTTVTQRWLDAPVPLTVLFDAPTVAGCARTLQQLFPAEIARRLATPERERGEL